VIDELHVLRGVFGTHVSHLLRRLRRVCAHYGSTPTFIFCSATIGQPARLASELCGLPVQAITSDGSPRGGRRFVLLNPPVIDEASGARTSANAEAASLMARLVENGHRTIAFCASRKRTELVARDVRRRLPEHRNDAVRSYRGGYLATERREIEAELATGAVEGVVATSALELGVDIGGLDACILNGFPGTIASMWQQAGRAGRGSDDSLAVLVAGDDQLDQWLMAHPQEVFSRSPEPAVINPQNPFVADPHLACAAHELPLTHADARYWDGDDLHDGVRRLVLDDLLNVRVHRDEVMAVWAGRGWPSRGVGLRSGSSVEYRIAFADGRLVGTIDEARAFQQVHSGAIYLHRGDTYRVTDLDLDDRVALVEPADGSEYTQTRSDTAIAVLGADQQRAVGQAELTLGSVEVVTRVVGYQTKDASTRRLIASHGLDLPPQQLATRAFWYTVSPQLLADAAIDDVPGTLHAVEHAAIAMLPLFTICDRWDVGGVSTAMQADTGRPTIFVYDAYPGGAGIAELGYSAADRHLLATLELLQGCRCTDGCPSCVQSPKCGNGNEPLDKRGAIALLRALLTEPCVQL
jgi:DEAD/DEAH box helicase domain-containing protein